MIMSNKKTSTTEVSLSLPNALPVPRMHNSSSKRSFVTRLVARPTNDISIQFQVPGYCFLLKGTDRMTVTFCKHQEITVFFYSCKISSWSDWYEREYSPTQFNRSRHEINLLLVEWSPESRSLKIYGRIIHPTEVLLPWFRYQSSSWNTVCNGAIGNYFYMLVVQNKKNVLQIECWFQKQHAS